MLSHDERFAALLNIISPEGPHGCGAHRPTPANANLEETVMAMNYPQRHQELQALFGKLGKELPGPISGFARLHKDSVAQGAIPAKVKELMALAIAIAIQCDDCIAYHVHDALRAGATRQEILEAIGVALMMGGGPASMYGCRAYEALGQFEGLSKAS
jgi:AhpD family alkylhydroperoxidase